MEDPPSVDEDEDDEELQLQTPINYDSCRDNNTP